MSEAKELPIPTSYNIAAQQVRDAQQELLGDGTEAAPLPWSNLQDLVGPPLPRDLWVVGARPANGKTTFLLNFFDALVSAKQRVLYIGAGSEGPPKDIRREWAAMRCGYPRDAVLERRWHDLPAGACDRVFEELQRQALEQHEFAHFADVGEKLTVKALVEAMDGARRDGCTHVILDHIHRMRFDAATDERRALSDTTHWLRDMAARYDMVVIVAAQLHRIGTDKGPLRDLIPPVMEDLKGTGTLDEDAVVGLLLHKTRRAGVSAKDVASVVKNERQVSEIIEPETMCVRVGKQRRRGHVIGHAVFLRITQDGALTRRESPYGVDQLTFGNGNGTHQERTRDDDSQPPF